MKVLALTRYGDLGASSRLRMFQYLPYLTHSGMDVHTQALFDNETLANRYAAGGYGKADFLSSFVKRIAALRQRHSFDLLWIEKEALPWFPYWFESSLLAGVPYVLDFDDAVFHNYDMHRLWLIRRLFGDRIDQLMGKAALVICGNHYLARRARDAGAKQIELLETVIDEHRYIAKDYATADSDKPLSIVWIGSPSTLIYLQMLAQPLKQLASTVNLELKVIGGEVELPGVNVRCVSWAESTEVHEIRSSDIGVMPLFDTPWEQGKCGYKLIQYMACGLPVVASPIGANNDIVTDGVNGFLAADSKQWESHLRTLIESASLRQSMGLAGRDLVEQKYCFSVAAPKLVNWLLQASEDAPKAS
jgi:glycosyltransferase involved in cell wall biosynthesis